MSIRKNESAREKKSRGLYRVLGPRARLKYKGNPITSGWIFDTSWFLLPSPPASQRGLSSDYSTPRTALPPPSPGLRADASPPLRCPLWREQSEQGEPRCTFPRQGGGSALRRLKPAPQAAQPPLTAVRQHPHAPSAARVSLLSCETFSFQLSWNYSHPVPFE